MENYDISSVYCLDSSDCADVYTPGCIRNNTGQCITAESDVYIKADTIYSEIVNCALIESDSSIICILESDSSLSDMCVTDFNEENNECYNSDSTQNNAIKIKAALGVVGVIIGLLL